MTCGMQIAVLRIRGLAASCRYAHLFLGGLLPCLMLMAQL